MTLHQRTTLLLLVAISAYAHWALASTSFSIQLDSTKAAGFAWNTFVSQPHAFIDFGSQIIFALALYGAYFWVIAQLSRPSNSFNRSSTRPVALVIATWTAVSWLILRWNQLWFPGSVWAWAIEPITQQNSALVLDFACIVWTSWRIGLRTHASIRTMRWHRSMPSMRVSLLMIIVVGATLYGTISARFSTPTQSAYASQRNQPNVVVIGLDSLRRDVALSDDPVQMPTLQRLRRNSFVQSNVVSPLARTFPAWVTMLTGKSARDSGIRGNLVTAGNAGKSSVAWNFRQHGYRTIYATDETRFSNIEEKFGFDQVVSPLPGVSDFLLGQFGDQPLINLAIQAPGAEFLFPSLVGNRAFSQAYRPSRFIRRLKAAIGPAGNRPTFIAIHLCLAHWPYHSSMDETPGSSYYNSTRVLDDQLNELHQALEVLNYINKNTIVVLLADHGEGLQPSSNGSKVQQTLYGARHPVTPQMGGHGGTLLDAIQWQVFFMFSGRSVAGKIPPGQSDQLLSLQDLPIALEALAGIPIQTALDGVTPDVVFKTIGTNKAPIGRIRTEVEIETGFTPKGFNLTHPDGDAALRIAESTYDITEDGRLEMKQTALRQATNLKDYGVTDGQRVLALMRNGPEPQLVFANGPNWDVYPVDVRPAGVENPPLLEAACKNPDMRPRIEAWCDSMPYSAPPALLRGQIGAGQHDKG
ncbi:DUF229 domain-containing protein [Sinimarinibacterium sp. CAU 1509]|uniref:sulfatase-like hydrolase/transferase n=1 Tax=Sinimarinibacterium sp. CAU 1509 TaxID=2562283 RepID=UPI0010AD9402|nr:sulfatase-like hydrolase/transferase [Sinimarinibacterium sp. CAU 1509]TJY65179.1 DUF229 domain-containing protein [Sinimarinibacterium sp. CAU 1509]